MTLSKKQQLHAFYFEVHRMMEEGGGGKKNKTVTGEVLPV